MKELAKVLRGNIQGLKSDEYNHLDVDPIADNYEGVFWDLAQATPRLNAQTLKRALPRKRLMCLARVWPRRTRSSQSGQGR